MSHSAEKCNRGTLWYLLTYNQLQNIKNLEGGTDPFETVKKFFKKSGTVPKKSKGGDTLGSSGFVGYLEKVKNERGDPLDYVSAGRTWP